MRFFILKKRGTDIANLQLTTIILCGDWSQLTISYCKNAWILYILVDCQRWQEDTTRIKFKTHILQVHLYLHVVRRGKVERTHPTDVIKMTNSPKSDGQIFDRRSNLRIQWIWRFSEILQSIMWSAANQIESDVYRALWNCFFLRTCSESPQSSSLFVVFYVIVVYGHFKVIQCVEIWETLYASNLLTLSNICPSLGIWNYNNYENLSLILLKKAWV